MKIVNDCVFPEPDELEIAKKLGGVDIPVGVTVAAFREWIEIQAGQTKKALHEATTSAERQAIAMKLASYQTLRDFLPGSYDVGTIPTSSTRH